MSDCHMYLGSCLLAYEEMWPLIVSRVTIDHVVLLLVRLFSRFFRHVAFYVERWSRMHRYTYVFFGVCLSLYGTFGSDRHIPRKHNMCIWEEKSSAHQQSWLLWFICIELICTHPSLWEVSNCSSTRRLMWFSSSLGTFDPLIFRSGGWCRMSI